MSENELHYSIIALVNLRRSSWYTEKSCLLEMAMVPSPSFSVAPILLIFRFEMEAAQFLLVPL